MVSMLKMKKITLALRTIENPGRIEQGRKLPGFNLCRTVRRFILHGVSLILSTFGIWRRRIRYITFQPHISEGDMRTSLTLIQPLIPRLPELA